MVRRACLPTPEPFDVALGLIGGEDTLLGWHIVRATGSPPVFADDALVRHRIEPRTYRGWLHAKSGIWIFVALLAHVPELRRRMFMHWFLNKRTAMFDDGRSRELDYSIRLYSLHELGKMLHDCGFKVVEVTGHPAHAGVFFGAESPRIIVLAERS